MDLPAPGRAMSASPDRTTIAAVLADVARIGPWFAVGLLPAGAAVPSPGRSARAGAGGTGPRRWDELHAPPGAGADPLSARIDQVAAALRTDRRVAASIAVQGMAARLVSMPFAAVALHGVLPSLGDLHRDPGADDPWAPALPAEPVAVVTPDARTDPHGAAGLLARELAGTHLEPLYAAVGARVSVSERVLRGNVVSAIAGAARVMDTARPEDRPAFLALLDALVGHPGLAGPLPDGATGRLSRPAGDAGWTFHRRSCCLYVRVPGGGTCGDCVLAGRG
ncbi:MULTISPECIES: (2Fe-2S)-binding protein [unclassified Pseudonocardia]|uniref:(2Fe-2S)-binding protein n=1 Tax=unclassified Pseudonocardia TaxID=2619320 RepID=UPI000A79C750|nr:MULTISPECIES: (2Fe-2S)-binding protein [unclassified Pseudonocardia]